MKGHHWALKLRALKRSLLATAGVSTISVALGGAAFAAPGVTPSTVTDTLLPGASQTISKSVETSPIPPNPDIFFLADTTGSMGGAVANVRTGNANVMATVLTAQPTAEFGVGEYKDTTDAFAYRLNQAITANTADVQTGMNAWVATWRRGHPRVPAQRTRDARHGLGDRLPQRLVAHRRVVRRRGRSRSVQRRDRGVRDRGPRREGDPRDRDQHGRGKQPQRHRTGQTHR